MIAATSRVEAIVEHALRIPRVIGRAAVTTVARVAHFARAKAVRGAAPDGDAVSVAAGGRVGAIVLAKGITEVAFGTLTTRRSAESTVARANAASSSALHLGCVTRAARRNRRAVGHAVGIASESCGANRALGPRESQIAVAHTIRSRSADTGRPVIARYERRQAISWTTIWPAAESCVAAVTEFTRIASDARTRTVRRGRAGDIDRRQRVA